VEVAHPWIAAACVLGFTPLSLHVARLGASGSADHAVVPAPSSLFPS